MCVPSEILDDLRPIILHSGWSNIDNYKEADRVIRKAYLAGYKNGKMDSGLDEDYIRAIKKDPIKWRAFKKKGKALSELIYVIKDDQD